MKRKLLLIVALLMLAGCDQLLEVKQYDVECESVTGLYIRYHGSNLDEAFRHQQLCKKP